MSALPGWLVLVIFSTVVALAVWIAVESAMGGAW